VKLLTDPRDTDDTEEVAAVAER